MCLVKLKSMKERALKEMQADFLQAPEEDMEGSPLKRSMFGQSTFNQSYLAQKSAKKVGFGRSTVGFDLDGRLDKSQAFSNSIDIMKSLWSEQKPSKKTATAKGFEV